MRKLVRVRQAPSWAARLVACALLSCSLLLAGCGDKTLYSKLSEQEANEMLSVLAGAGIPARKSAADDQTWNLETDEAQFANANGVLREHGLPQTKFASMGDIFKKDSLMSTRNEERMRYIHAMSQELSKTLSLIDGVVAVRVQPVIPASDPMAPPDRLLPSSASVFIKHRADVDLRPRSQAIKELVMASIEGLQYDKIALSFFPAMPTETAPQREAPASWSGQVVVALSLLLALALLGAAGLMFGKAPLQAAWASLRKRLHPAPGDAA
jgi:type III secretion protein J